MTKEEAKLVLDNARPQTKEIDRQFYDDEDLNNALDMAIKALEQQSEDCKIFSTKENCFGGADCENCDYKIQPLMQPTSDDCVSRAEVIDELNRLGRNAFKDDTDYDNFFAFVDSLPPVTPTQRWIPVSERLPEDRNIVLVTAYWHETYQVMMASYFGDGLWWCVPFNNCGDHMQKLNPKAWQPLPKPYEEKRGNESEIN